MSAWLRPLDISANDANISSACLHSRLDCVTADRDLTDDAIGSVEPDLRPAGMLDQVGSWLTPISGSRVIVFDVIADDLQVVNVATQ